MKTEKIYSGHLRNEVHYPFLSIVKRVHAAGRKMQVAIFRIYRLRYSTTVYTHLFLAVIHPSNRLWKHTRPPVRARHALPTCRG
jgi:hypothetical protein